MKHARESSIVLAPWGCICESCYSDSDEYAAHVSGHDWHHGENCMCDNGGEAPPEHDKKPWPAMPDGFRYLTEDELARGDQGSSCEDCGEPWGGLPEDPETLLDHDHSMDG